MSGTATARTAGSIRDAAPAKLKEQEQKSRVARGAPGELTRTEHTLLHATERLTQRRDTWHRRSLAAADILALLMAEAVVRVVIPPDASLLDRWYLLVGLPLWVILNKVLRLYDRDANLIHKSTLDELPMIALSITLGTALLFLFAPAIPGVELGRVQCIVFLAAALVMTPTLRWSARSLVRARVAPERCLIVGSGQVAEIVARKLTATPRYGARVVGYIDVEPDGPGTGAVQTLPHLGDDEAFEAVCRRFDVERIVVAFSSLSEERLLDIVRMSKRLHVKITVVPRLYEVIGGGVEIDQIQGLTLLGLRGVMRTKSTLALKRAIDIVGASLGLVAMAPALLTIAIGVKLSSRGPVLFRQQRVGRDNREFTMMKFRTMVQGAEELKTTLGHLNEMAAGPMFKITDDPRTTPFGRLLRRVSLDELPQLINVLRGEMSLVGPRPLIPTEDDHVIGWHRARLDLTPGLTGPWQVMGRNDVPFEEMIKLDYLYVAEWSLWNDVKLMVRTLPVMVMGNGR